ncbi:Uridylate kinase [Escovopsis weberi]|uniref:Uridylate kinase n=1 Tax=Escovopsis weberi TaxID=150374 RepID=A0A0M8MW59_ESCWE|nr:Uridylate kinase [Escovopsis weberi]
MEKIDIIFVLGNKGSPGAGKGTLCKRLAAEHGLKHLSTGDLCRQAVSAPDADPLVVDYMSRQQPLTAEMLLPILRAQIESLRGQCSTLVLDGFPRKMGQLQPFEEAFGDPLVVLFFDCPEELAEDRVVHRVANRAGDDRETFRRRYGEFLQWNPPICEYYGKKGKVLSVSDCPAHEQKA